MSLYSKIIYPLALILLIIGSCKTDPKPLQKIIINGNAQGTYYNITYFDEKGRNFKSDIDSLLMIVDKSVSIYDTASIISRVNNNDTSVIIDMIFVENFNLSQKISALTQGSFDITVGPLVNAWGFGFKKKEKITTILIDSLLNFVGFQNVAIINGKVQKKHSGIRIDFNAIAQGYSVDLVGKYFDDIGIQNYLIDIGGEVMGKGKKPDGKSWVVGIDKPLEDGNYDHQLQAKLKLDDKSLATSGNYRKFYIENGVKYSHTIDPKTGYPVQHSLLSATVLANDCGTADALATAFMVMGVEKAKIFLQNNPDFDAYLIYAGKSGIIETFITKGVEQKLITD